MNILLGKLGGIGTYFGEGYKEYGNDLIAKLFLDFCRKHPENNYYVCTTNDISTFYNGFNSSKKPKNLIDFYTTQKDWCKRTGRKVSRDDSYIMLEECLKENNIQPDLVIMQAASCANAALWDLTYKYDLSGLRQPLTTCRNGAQLIYYVSTHQDVKCSWLLDDPRIFLTYPIDLIKRPDNVASQSNETVRMKVCCGYGEASKNYKINTIKCQYSHLEKYFLKGKQKVDWRNDKRTNKFIMTLHGLPDRAKLYKRWIYDFDKSIKVYGKNWTENASTRGCVDSLKLPHDNFVNKPIVEIEDLMWNSKYTYIPPVSMRYKSFVTQKVWTMLYYGIIPFWCKYDYDTSNIYNDFPDFIKVETPEEMWDKINVLESDSNKHNEIREKLFKLLDDRYFNTDFVLDEVEKICLNDKL